MSIFDEILGKRRLQGSLGVGGSFIPLSVDDEILGLEAWMISQRQAKNPDIFGWRTFWNSQFPFFAIEIGLLLNGYFAANILHGADPIAKPANLRYWICVEPANRFLFENLDATRCALFDGDILVVLNRQSPDQAYRFGPHIEPDGNRDRRKMFWSDLACADVLDVLLESWEAGRPKARFARERLCDIAHNVLGKRRP